MLLTDIKTVNGKVILGTIVAGLLLGMGWGLGSQVMKLLLGWAHELVATLSGAQ